MSDGKSDGTGLGEAVEVGSPIEPKTVERQRENMRERLVIHLNWSVTLVIVTSLIVAAAFPDRMAAIKELLVLVMPGLFGAYGTALGFYFSQKK